VLAGVAAVLLLTAFADRLLGRRVALLVPPLLVTNPLFVRYAVEARSYALLLALACASGLLLLRAVRAPSTSRCLAYAVLCGVAVYAQYFTLLMVAGQLLAVLLLRGSGLRARHVLPAAAALLLLLAPLPRLMTEAAAGGVGYLEGSPLARVLPPLLAVAVAVAAVAVGLAVRRRPRGTPVPLRVAADGWPIVLLVLWLVVPVVLAVLLSVLRSPVLAPRYFTVCLPPAVLLLAWLLSRRPLGLAVPAVALLGAAGLAVGVAWIDRQSEDWDAVAAHVAATADAGDEVLFVAPYVRLPYERYHRSATAADPAYPGLPWDADLAPLFFFTPMPQAEVRAAVRDARDVHLVVSHVGLYDSGDPAYREVTDALTSASFALVGERLFQGVVVQQWSASPS
jgi:mannosyltransferase